MISCQYRRTDHHERDCDLNEHLECFGNVAVAGATHGTHLGERSEAVAGRPCSHWLGCTAGQAAAAGAHGLGGHLTICSR